MTGNERNARNYYFYFFIFRFPALLLAKTGSGIDATFIKPINEICKTVYNSTTGLSNICNTPHANGSKYRIIKYFSGLRNYATYILYGKILYNFNI